MSRGKDDVCQIFIFIYVYVYIYIFSLWDAIEGFFGILFVSSFYPCDYAVFVVQIA